MIHSRGINRIRHYYPEQAPESERISSIRIVIFLLQ